jgi:hypothetical protein
MNPTNFNRLRNRNSEVSIEKHLDFLIHLKAACEQGKRIGSLETEIRNWRLSSMSARVILKIKIIEPLGNGKYKWNGLNGNLDPNRPMVNIIREEVRAITNIYVQPKSQRKQTVTPVTQVINEQMVEKMAKIWGCLPNELPVDQRIEMTIKILGVV